MLTHRFIGPLIACLLGNLAVVRSALPDVGQDRKGPSDSHRAEVKVSVDSEDILLALKALDFRWENKKMEDKRIFFYETPDRGLFRQGVVLRARKGKDLVSGAELSDDVTVKIRPIEADRVSSTWFDQTGFKLETDSLKDHEVLSASLTLPVKEGMIDRAFAGIDLFPGDLFSKSHLRMLKDLTPALVPWNELVAIGPVRSYSWNVSKGGEAVDVELWILAEGVKFLELSMKTVKAEIPAKQAFLSGLLRNIGLRESRSPTTKTEFVLGAGKKPKEATLGNFSEASLF